MNPRIPDFPQFEPEKEKKKNLALLGITSHGGPLFPGSIVQLLAGLFCLGVAVYCFVTGTFFLTGMNLGLAAINFGIYFGVL